MAPIENNPALPNYIRPEVLDAQPDLALVHDLLGGTRRMHQRSSVYVRKWKDEDTAVYDIRRTCETVFEGVGRTLSAAVGMLFAKEPTIEWNASETAFTDIWLNLDAAGTAGPVLIKRFADMALRDGIGIILVDHPSAPEGVTVTGANEKALGLRPTWALYERGQAINWRTGIVNNRRVLTLLVLHECAEVETGVFGIGTVHRYRVLSLVNGLATWTLYEQLVEKPTESSHFKVVGSGSFTNRNGNQANFLPVSIAYTGRTDAIMSATIPLLGVAWANLSHWLSATDLRFYRSLCAFPQPVVTGELSSDPATGTPGVLKMGPMVGVKLAADADFKWAELAGTSLDQLVQGVREKLDQMGAMGLAFLASDTRAAETAEAKRIDAVAQNATLATAAQGTEDAVNLALEHTAWFLGIEKAGAPMLRINRDFELAVMGSDVMGAYASLIGQGYPKRLVLEAFQAGGRIPADADLDEIEMEWDAGQAAREEQAALDAAERARQIGEGAPMGKAA